MEKTALIVDDDRTERRMIAGVLRKSLDLGYIEAENGREALRVLGREDGSHDIVLVVLDLEMPVMGGLPTLEVLSERYSAIPVIVLTGNDRTGEAVRAMKMGAVDFLSKPVESARLDVSARNALKMLLMGQEISRLKNNAQQVLRFSDLIGHESGLKDNIRIGRKASLCNLPVLLTGETGTGKEMFARAIHGESNRANSNFVAVNCGAIPEKLVESTLFGHEKGSFTGAINKAPGKFREANGGTIFLDEVGELPLDAQVKLLRVLQQGEVEPVGAPAPVPVDVRVISATNRDLSEAVKVGSFREDLFFRLNVLHIPLLPLRTRKEDIPVLIGHFVAQFCKAQSVEAKDIDPQAMEKLCRHSWPGNVRELENLVNRMMALCEKEVVESGDISFVMQNFVENAAIVTKEEGVVNPLNADGSFKTLSEIEEEIVAIALAHHKNNVSQTARSLGIAKSTLYTKMEKLAERKTG